MKVLAGLVTQGTGSIGGMTMSKNKQGYYLRSRTVPSNPRTIKQSAIRSGLSALSATWQSLTDAQRNGWNLYSKNVSVVLDNGQTKILSGFNWYIGANQLRLLCGEDALSDAPSIYTLAPAPMVRFCQYVTASMLVFDFSVLGAVPNVGSGDQLLIQIGRPQTLGTLYFKGPWQYIDCIDTADADVPVTLDLSGEPDYIANDHQAQWIRVTRILPDGRYSTPVFYGPFVGGVTNADYGFSSNPWLPSFTAGVAHQETDVTSTPNLTQSYCLTSLPTGMTFASYNNGVGLICDNTIQAGDTPLLILVQGTLGTQVLTGTASVV